MKRTFALWVKRPPGESVEPIVTRKLIVRSQSWYDAIRYAAIQFHEATSRIADEIVPDSTVASVELEWRGSDFNKQERYLYIRTRPVGKKKETDFSEWRRM